MTWGLLSAAAGICFACSSVAGTRILTFVYQPLTTLGTAQDAAIVVARIPVITKAVPESIISHIASANQLLQDASAQVADSNLLSLLRIRLSAEFVSERHYRLSLDVREMRPSARFGVTAEEVISAATKCLRATFDEQENLGSYELRIQAKAGDKTNWSRYEGRHESKKKLKKTGD